ncbi:FAD binding domain-containing protein [Flavisolibacter nicotianae]|uniref:FAD binding domain-containing protein n=1 Tax=Flavisolibacter nicotianae TaxID=2364882 RepID=UPI000EAB8C85|nr:xanthine dehydrogenase family protein subunit M [Flavisolibacter nicotianae]
MIPTAFDYTKPATVEEAIAALSDGDSKLLAGGYSLIPAMKMRLTQPSKLVDISGIPSLKGIKEEDGEIVINAGTTHYEILTNDLIKNRLPFFTQAAGIIGDVQVRNRGTIGGSLAHADPAADWPAPVLAAEAIIDVKGTGGGRSIPATDFFTGLFSTQLLPDEIIVAIRIPVQEGARSVYLSFEQPASRFAIVGCAVLRKADGRVNIAFTGVSEAPFRDRGAEAVFDGKSWDTATIDTAVDAAIGEVDVLSDHFASSEYRRHLAKVYLKRALQALA